MRKKPLKKHLEAINWSLVDAGYADPTTAPDFAIANELRRLNVDTSKENIDAIRARGEAWNSPNLGVRPFRAVEYYGDVRPEPQPQPIVTDEQRQADRQRQAQKVERDRAGAELLGRGWSDEAIAAKLGVRIDVVANWRRKADRANRPVWMAD